ncbi:MAG: hypothetical protein K8T91_03435 [Planctomycetes bacterium]|nr:hypothetical protein [Planctomycetota bacterium]
MVASIDYIEQVIRTYEEAAAANRATPGRQGSVIELTADLADEVMITADLHGHRPNFNAIRRIADLANHPGRHLVMQEVCHGGPSYPGTGGCMSHMMLEDVAKLKTEFPQRVHFLMSNHELAELTDYPILKNSKMLNLMFRFGMQEMYGQAIDRVRGAMLEFLRTVPLAVRVAPSTWISHTIPERLDQRKFDISLFDRELADEDLAEGSPVFSLVWGRDYRQQNADAFAKLVGAEVMIHGHEPCPDGFFVPNTRQVIIDCHAERACYMILPVGQPLTQHDVMERVQRLR